VSDTLAAIILWACAAFFGWTAYRAIQTGSIRVGASDIFKFDRDKRPIFFWYFTAIFVLFTVLSTFGAIGAMLDLPPPITWLGS